MQDDRDRGRPTTIVQIEHFRRASRKQSLDDQAIDWLARLRNPQCSAAEQAEFALWLHTDASHQRAFDEAALLWELAGPAIERSAVKPQPTYSRKTPLSVAAGLLIACFAFVLSLAPLEYDTAKGEQMRLMLVDGTTVMLNTDSEIKVDYRGDSRHVELLRGEAWFDVTSDVARPFTVATDTALVTVVGTAFAVRETPQQQTRPDGTTLVQVTEGRVKVQSRNLAPYEQDLAPGQKLRVTTTGYRLDAFDPASALAWRQGQLVYQDVSLGELLADLNRYVPRNMVLVDDTLATRRVSAVLRLSDQDAMLDALGRALDVNWKTVSDELVLITPTS